MMINWNGYVDKKCFFKLRNGSLYTGLILNVDDSNPNGLIFIEINDKFDKRVIICSSEIIKIEVIS